MIKENLSVRELKEADFENIVDYFLNSDKDFLVSMGIDTSKLPSRDKWLNILTTDFYQSLEKKKFCYVIWLFGNKSVGHSNINKIIFKEEAYMHLHLWDEQIRKMGIGHDLLKMTLPVFL